MTIDPASVPLLGPATATAAQARAYARARGARRLEELDAFVAEVWRLGGAAGYDPAVVFAQFCDETGAGTSNAWATRLNPGGIGITDGGDRGIGFASGVDAARAMLVHLSAYVRGYDPHLWRYLALDPRYLEPLKAGYGGSVRTLADLGDGRWATNPNYARQIAAHLAALRATVPGAPASAAAARSDGAAPATPPAGIVWLGSPNWHERTGGQGPEAIVYHVTDDLNFANVRSHFQRPDSRASSHFVVERDGTIYQFVGTAKAAWTNGDVAEPRRDLRWLAAAVRRCYHAERNPTGTHNMNDFTITIECMGKPGLPFPPAQIARVVELSRYLLARYPAIRPTRGRLLRHSDINAVGRSYCPGPTFPLREVILTLGGDPGDFS